MDGFNLDSPLICEGIIGDGCGGGRLFIVESETLKVYDPVTKEKFLLLEGVISPLSISKSACIITIVCKNDKIIFDLSSI